MSVPALRFRREDGLSFPAWKSLKLSKLADIYDGTHMTPDYKKSGIPFYSVEHVTSNNFKETRFITKDVYEKENKRVKLEKGDILMTRIGDIGTPRYIDWDVEASFYVSLALIKQSTRVNSQFLAHYINTEFFQRELHQRIIHVAFPKKINLGEIGECLVSLPTKDEQTKIANFLTAVDKEIAQLRQKCELLAQYKKGVMQQIFSQELRFKDGDGQEFFEWEEYEFGKVYEFIPTNSYSREMLTYEGGSVQNIHYGDIHTRYKSNFKLTRESVPYLSGAVDVSKIKDAHYCQKGDIVIADASEDYADVGKAIEVIEVGNQKLVGGLHTYIARDTHKKLAVGFGGYLMQSSDVRSQIKVLATGVSVLSISKSNLAKVSIKLPCKAEQTKIANFLTVIDDKLTHTQNQLAAIKQYKQGLLQQMFV